MPAAAVAAVAPSIIKAGGSVIAGNRSAKAARKAAETEAQARERALALQKEMFDRQVELQEPFRQAGVTSTNELMRQLGLSGDAASEGYGNLMRDFTMADYEADPGYAFRVEEGLKALDRQAAARGGLISGAALKAAGRYGQRAASEEYQNAYDRYNKNRAIRYGFLTGQQDVGIGAANTVGSAAQNYASQGGNEIVGAGQARATGYWNAAQARNAMLNNLINAGSQLAGGYGTTWGPGSQPSASNQSAWKNPNSNALFNRLVGPRG